MSGDNGYNDVTDVNDKCNGSKMIQVLMWTMMMYKNRSIDVLIYIQECCSSCDVLFITCDFSPSLIALALSASPEAYSSHNGVHTFPGETLHQKVNSFLIETPTTFGDRTKSS